MATMAEIGKRIKAARIDAGINQVELSQMFDNKIAPNRISHLESAAHCVIRSDEAELYSKLFGLPIDDLTITGERPKGWAMRGEYYISDICKSYMKAKGVKTLREIADTLDISKNRVRAIINGGSLARKDEAIKLARYFEIQGATEKEFLSTAKEPKKEAKIMSNAAAKKDIQVEGNWRDKAFELQKEVNDLRTRLAEEKDNTKLETELQDLKAEVSCLKNLKDEEHDRAERYKESYHDVKDKLEKAECEKDMLKREYDLLKEDMFQLLLDYYHSQNR